MSKKKLLINIFSKILNIDNIKDIKKAELNKSYTWDSVNHIKLILEIEKNYKIKIPNNKINKLNNFNKIEKLINSNLR